MLGGEGQARLRRRRNSRPGGSARSPRPAPCAGCRRSRRPACIRAAPRALRRSRDPLRSRRRLAELLDQRTVGEVRRHHATGEKDRFQRHLHASVLGPSRCVLVTTSVNAGSGGPGPGNECGMPRMLPALIASARHRRRRASPAVANRFKHIDHIVVVYEENHSFDNLYGGWEARDGLGAAPTPRTRSRSTRTATPYSCLMQNDVNLTSPRRWPRRARTRRPARRSRARSPTRRSRSTTTSRRRHDVPGTRACSRQRRAERAAAAGRVHARPRAPLLPGAVPARRRQAGPLRHGQRRRRPDDGLLRHAGAADLRLPARQASPAATRSPTGSSRARSAARSSTTSG